MQARALVIVCANLLAGAVLAAQQPLPLVQEELMRSARTWEAHDRGDLARLALEKLAAARPDSAEALLELGELNLRMPDIAAAEKVLQRLNTRFPGSQAARTFATEYRLATRDRLQLASIQRLVQVQRLVEARSELDRVFPEGAPGGMLSIEYYRLSASTPGGWQPAHDGLKKLAAAHAGDPRYQLALARHLLRNEATTAQAVVILDALVRRDDVRTAEIESLLQRALEDSDYRAPPNVIDDYLARNPDDAEARTVLRARARTVEVSELVASDALARIDPDRQSRNLRELEKALAARTQADPRSQTARELAQLLDGQVPGTLSGNDATMLAASWVNHSRAARIAGQLDLAAAQLEAAVALRTGKYEAAIPVATRLDALGEDRSSGELLAAASRLDPQSSWLFETHLRWLINHGRTDEALALLEARPVDKRWTPQSRDALRATALDQRGLSKVAAGRAEEAIADYEAAIALAPQDPWSRYRLAGLYARRGDPARGRAVIDEGARRAPGNAEIQYALGLYLASIDDYESALAAVESIPAADRSEGAASLHARVRRELDMRRIRALEREGNYTEAARELDRMSALTPGDRDLRVARAELDLAAGLPLEARDRFAALVAQWPDDVSIRLSYVRALIETKETELARLQLQSAQELVQANDVDLQLSIARRQLALRDYAAADQTLRTVLAITPQRDDVAAQARQAMSEIELRLRSWMEGGVELRHKPGDEGISKFDAVLLPTSWMYARDYEQRLVLRADGVTMDAGKLSRSFDEAALLGTIQAAGPMATRAYDNDAQSGLSLGAGYLTDTLSADIGTTPLGFRLTNIVGGVEWTPAWGPIDVGLGVSRRAVTSSVLSYGGLRDPISGVEWGGVVQTGPYARFGLYRERYSISGSLTATELTGTRVPDNTFLGLRMSADWKFFARDEARAYVGVTINRWSYDKNLQNYTFGSGGYYSPQSYLSIVVPVELQGAWRGWSYRLRAALSHSSSRIDRIAFYPNDSDLQSLAAASPLPPGYDEPYFAADRNSGSISMSAYGAVERQISRTLVLGAKLDIDRADYYEPTTFMFYLRRTLGSLPAPLFVLPRPTRPYSDY